MQKQKKSKQKRSKNHNIDPSLRFDAPRIQATPNEALILKIRESQDRGGSFYPKTVASF
jgi:hypothetical protein